MEQGATSPNPLFDIAAWTCGAEAYRDHVRQSKRGSDRAMFPTQMVRLERADPRFVYALFVEFIAPKPNGVYTMLQQGAPVDNLIWWDFFIAHGPHLVGFLSGANGMEAHIYSAPTSFHAERFLLASTQRHAERVNARANRFERHEVFVNHFRSYKESLAWLSTEVSSLDVDSVNVRGGVSFVPGEAQHSADTLQAFRLVALKFHVLAKSLLMTAAFSCEALVSTLLRIGALPPLRQDPEQLLFPVLRTGFSQKLRVIHAYTLLFPRPLDLDADPIRAAQLLMDARNKYVHSELSEHVRLEDIYFDGYFPLFGGRGVGQLSSYYERAYLTPRKGDVLAAVATANRFEDYILSSIAPDLRPQINVFLNQPQISFNTTLRMYSVTYPRSPFQTFISVPGGAEPLPPEPVED